MPRQLKVFHFMGYRSNLPSAIGKERRTNPQTAEMVAATTIKEAIAAFSSQIPGMSTKKTKSQFFNFSEGKNDETEAIAFAEPGRVFYIPLDEARLSTFVREFDWTPSNEPLRRNPEFIADPVERTEAIQAMRRARNLAARAGNEAGR